ncbi:MAG: GxxExxY protein [Candidatus Liptonbacteria bacterium]|nr:GxxExxY protein [Candidatus Liptonbacteria bacterium]
MVSLQNSLSEVKGIGPKFIAKLKRLKIETVKDILWHFPVYYQDWNKITLIKNLKAGERAVIKAKILNIKYRRTWRKKMAVIEALINDGSGTIRVIWFNQYYIKNILTKGKAAFFAGKVMASPDDIYLSNPHYEIINEQNEKPFLTGLLPIYPEVKGLTSKGIRFVIKKIIPSLEIIQEFVPKKILTDYGLPEINKAIFQIHNPGTEKEAQLARKRFEFEELFLLQLNNLTQKRKLRNEKAIQIQTDIEFIKKIIESLPFKLTFPQKRSLWEILQNLNRQFPMNRLLQGDVGSGKTVVAAIASVLTAKNGFQACFMAPTEILANQHYQTFKKLFGQFNYPIALLTSKSAIIFYAEGLETEIKKQKIIEDIKNGKIKIIIGTHALIQKNIIFNNLAFVVIDEQHRFGVRQRALLTQSQVVNTSEFINNDKIAEKKLFSKLKNIFLKIQEEIGSFCQEEQYADVLEKKLKEEKINFKRELPTEVEDKKPNFINFIIENRILINLKSKPLIEKSDYYQMKYCLEITNLELGLIINFQDKYLKLKRILGDKKIVNSNNLMVSNQFLPHFLSMSATPIPRTLAITIFGDLDLSIIDELPLGRKPIITKIVAPINRNKAYDFIHDQVKKGKQVFVICPRIDNARTETDYEQTNPDNQYESVSNKHRPTLLWEVKAVKEEYKKLSEEIFPDLKVAMVHGKIKAKEKNQIISDFKDKKYDILVSTSVVEVGVDIPNATIMMIEGAEKFGLAQLYQFRGRVGRNIYQSFCFLFTDSFSKATHYRLRALIEAKNGFELAEKDLRIRGPGEFLGTEQTGLPDTAMRALKNPKLIKESREASQKILNKDPYLDTYPLLKNKLSTFQKAIHLE